MDEANSNVTSYIQAVLYLVHIFPPWEDTFVPKIRISLFMAFGGSTDHCLYLTLCEPILKYVYILYV